MPVLYARRADDDISGVNFLNRFSPFLSASQAGSDDQNLTYRMNMPVGSCAGFKWYAGSIGTHFVVGRVDTIYAGISGKNFISALD